MEIDVKKETEKVNEEMQVLTTNANQLQNQINILSQQRQEVINQLVKKQGELELLQRLNSKKKESVEAK